jgi:hypothetical protein
MAIICHGRDLRRWDDQPKPMNTAFYTNSERRVDLQHDRTDGLNGRRPSSCDTIYRRLSRLESGTRAICHHPSTTENPAKYAYRSGNVEKGETRRFQRVVRFVLVDRTGPVAKFETWEHAMRYMTEHRIQGGSILRIEEPLGLA